MNKKKKKSDKKLTTIKILLITAMLQLATAIIDLIEKMF